MLLLPLSGWIINSAVNIPVDLFWFVPLPAIAPPSESLGAVAKQLHLAFFASLALVVVVHMAAALRHHFLLRDQILSATWAPGTKPRSMLQVRITLNQVTQALRVPVIFEQKAGRIHARGQFRIRQTAFDLEPYSLFGGALAVEDWLDLSFDLEALDRNSS